MIGLVALESTKGIVAHWVGTRQSWAVFPTPIGQAGRMQDEFLGRTAIYWAEASFKAKPIPYPVSRSRLKFHCPAAIFVIFALTLPPRLLSNTVRLLLVKFTLARSGAPSPLKSARANARGSRPVP